MLKTEVWFENMLEEYPLLRARRRPGGAVEGGTRGMFSSMLKTDAYSQKKVENTQSHGTRGIFSEYVENRRLLSKYLENTQSHICENKT